MTRPHAFARLAGRVGAVVAGAWLTASAIAPAKAQAPAADPFATLPRQLAAATTLATLPAGTFLENMLVQRDGSVLITSYLAREVLRWRPDTGLSVVARLPGHPVSLAPDVDGSVYVVVHGRSFREGAAMPESQQLWRLPPQGEPVQVAAVPEARFLNGIAWIGAGRFLVADSLAGRIWVIDARTGAARTWLAHHKHATALPVTYGNKPT